MAVPSLGPARSRSLCDAVLVDRPCFISPLHLGEQLAGVGEGSKREGEAGTQQTEKELSPISHSWRLTPPKSHTLIISKDKAWQESPPFTDGETEALRGGLDSQASVLDAESPYIFNGNHMIGVMGGWAKQRD